MECFNYENIDVRNLSDSEFLEIRKSVPKYGVICIKNQNLNQEELISFTKKFGDPILLPEPLRFNNVHKEYPELARISNIKPDGTLIQNHSAAEYWHSDGDFWQPKKNYIFNFLNSIIVPQNGGETGFSDLRIAYNNLTQELKDKIENYSVTVNCEDIPDFKDVEEKYKTAIAVHKIKHEHIETGKIGLYIGHFKATIEGQSKEVSDQILKEISEVIDDPKCQYIHKYSEGDLLIWDNTSVMHRSMGGYCNHKRLLYRTQAFIEPLK